MTWATLKHSIEAVNAAGKLLETGTPDSAEFLQALDVINNWRSSHSFPLHTHYVGLRRCIRSVEKGGVAARRLKRLTSIEAKLSRFPEMKLSQMQDIGGCRAIVSSVPKVTKLVKQYKISRRKHDLVKEVDYISKPAATGYRGIHLVYRYKSDKNTRYNGRKIEIQIRSSAQHMWATAVEVYGTITNQMLKSNRGQEDWLRFFALMGTVIALHEKTPTIPGTPTSRHDLKIELSNIVKSLDVLTILENYGNTIQTSLNDGHDADYFLVELNPDTKQVSVKGYREKDLVKATRDYLQAEKTLKVNPRCEVVLVAVESIRLLRRAYPNYFLDTKSFLEFVKKAIA